MRGVARCLDIKPDAPDEIRRTKQDQRRMMRDSSTKGEAAPGQDGLNVVLSSGHWWGADQQNTRGLKCENLEGTLDQGIYFFTGQ